MIVWTFQHENGMKYQLKGRDEAKMALHLIEEGILATNGWREICTTSPA